MEERLCPKSATIAILTTKGPCTAMVRRWRFENRMSQLNNSLSYNAVSTTRVLAILPSGAPLGIQGSQELRFAFTYSVGACFLHGDLTAPCLLLETWSEHRDDLGAKRVYQESEFHSGLVTRRQGLLKTMRERKAGKADLYVFTFGGKSSLHISTEIERRRTTSNRVTGCDEVQIPNIELLDTRFYIVDHRSSI